MPYRWGEDPRREHRSSVSPSATYKLDLIRPDSEGKHVLHHVLLNANVELLQYLITTFTEYGLTFGSLEIEGNNALHLALSSAPFAKYRERSIECVKLLLKTIVIEENEVRGELCSIDINEGDRLGRTVLHLCAMYGLTELMQLFFTQADEWLKQPLDSSVLDIEGQSVFAYAVDYRQPQCLQMLVEAFGQEYLTEYDNLGYTLLQRALVNESWECFSLLLTIGKLEYAELVKSQNSETLEDLAHRYGLIQPVAEIITAFKAGQDVHHLLEAIIGSTRSDRKTLLLTDERCLDHAGFDQYHNTVKRAQQKDDQPENAERLMVLIDKDRGTLT